MGQRPVWSFGTNRADLTGRHQLECLAGHSLKSSSSRYLLLLHIIRVLSFVSTFFSIFLFIFKLVALKSEFEYFNFLGDSQASVQTIHSLFRFKRTIVNQSIDCPLNHFILFLSCTTVLCAHSSIVIRFENFLTCQIFFHPDDKSFPRPQKLNKEDRFSKSI